jgi:fructan beta-fructosidase
MNLSTMMRKILLPIILSFSVNAFAQSSFAQYDEPHRPQFHFSPPSMWMNDPNGMVYHNGEYHLFYQHYPKEPFWGPMHWGHAVSRDLIHWENLPIALAPDSLGYIFSGSAVFDKHNSTGFGTESNPPLVAMFTYHDPTGEKAGRTDYQSQGIAYSLDKGRTWAKYDENPGIPNAEKLKDFRDPKVFWHEETNRWLVVLAAGDRVRFYSSRDLKNWQMESEFGKGDGSHGGVWECPDLFPLKVKGTDRERWVLLLSINPGGVHGGSATQYFIGDFDGKTFRNENPPETVLWLDYGRDNYAGVTWSDAPNDRRIFIGWMSNWDYAEKVPTKNWRGAMTLPRELSLIKTEKGVRIAQNPVLEAYKLRRQKLLVRRNFTVGSEFKLNAQSPLNEIVFEVDLSKTTARDFGISLSNKHGENYRIGFNAASNYFYSDRTKAGSNKFADNFAPKKHTAPRIGDHRILKMRLLFDAASVELFADDGKTALTDIFFPTQDFNDFEIYAQDGTIRLFQLKMWKLKSIWK